MDPNRYRTPSGWRAFDHYRGDHPGEGRRPRHSKCAGRSGDRSSAPITRGGCALTRGRHIQPSGSACPCCASKKRGPSKRRSTRPARSARRRRTWSWPIAAATSAGPSTDRSRAGSASTACCPRRGPTAGAGGTAGSRRRVSAHRRPSGRAHLDRQRAGRGRARCSRTLGDGGYEVGSRATMIRDRLHARDRFTARDMLAIQLDTRPVFLSAGAI